MITFNFNQYDIRRTTSGTASHALTLKKERDFKPNKLTFHGYAYANAISNTKKWYKLEFEHEGVTYTFAAFNENKLSAFVKDSDNFELSLNNPIEYPTSFTILNKKIVKKPVTVSSTIL